MTKDENELSEHLLVHDDNAAHARVKRIHRCMDCGKIFDKPSQLERHMRIHTGMSANHVARMYFSIWFHVAHNLY